MAKAEKEIQDPLPELFEMLSLTCIRITAKPPFAPPKTTTKEERVRKKERKKKTNFLTLGHLLVQAQ